MTVGEAKRIARQWVADHAADVPGLWAVVFGGSINWLPDEAEFGASSDVDLWHYVRGDPNPPRRQRKLLHEGVILEPCCLPAPYAGGVDDALGDWVGGCHLTVPSVIYDPTGELTAFQRIVAERYAEPAWVRRRCESIASEIRSSLIPRLMSSPPDDTLFAFAYLGHCIQQIPVVASVKPPTNRKAGMVFTEMMAALSRRDVSEERFRYLGIERITREEAAGLLRHCLEAYDRAAEVWHTPLPFGDWDLMPGARGHMVDGVRDIFDRGYHREAVGWMTYMRWLSRAALKTDAPEEYETRWRPGFDRFFEVLGIGSIEALTRKAVLAEELLRKVMDVAELIMDGRAGAGPAGSGQR